MPELPEVETVRRSMTERVVGATIDAVHFRNFPGVIGSMSPEAFVAMVVGRTFDRIDRRGKHLWLAFSDGNGLFVHLMMTGQLTLVQPSDDLARFEHLRIVLDNGWALAYADQRKFGRVKWLSDDEWATIEQSIGPEPLDDEFTPSRLFTMTRLRTSPIKAFMLDQKKVAGIGNIYADEALYRARLHPGRVAGSISESEAIRLHRAIREVLTEGLQRRGTTLSDYRDANGEPGTNAANLRVYGRGGVGICLECGTSLLRINIAQRGTSFCPVCQPASAGTD